MHLLNQEYTIIKTIKDYEVPFVSEFKIYPEADKWLAASAMQKAIRRGQTEIALSAAFSLMRSDSAKLWKRVQVIALEDISFIDLELTRNILGICSQNKWRRKYLSDEKALIYIIDKLCQSNKSRIANDLLCIANAHPKEKKAAFEFHGLSNQELADIYLSNKFTSTERLIAGWYICGVYRRRYLNMQRRQGDWRYFLSLHNSNRYPDELRFTLKQGASSGEGHFRAIAISWEKLTKAQCLQLRNECILDSPYIGPWKSECFDIHTLYGQLAYKSVIRSCNPISSFMREYFPKQNHVRMLGMSIFAVEGMRLSKREMFSGVSSLLDAATDSYVANYNLSGNAKIEFFDIIENNLDLIHAERKKIASKIDWKCRKYSIVE